MPAKKSSSKTARRSSRSPTKQATGNSKYDLLPYSSAPSGPGSFLRKKSSLLGSVGRLFYREKPNAHGETTRDFPFAVRGAGPQFFTTSNVALEHFGVCHGDRVVYTHADTTEKVVATVVGLRGDRLWVVPDGSTYAECLGYATCKADLQDKYLLAVIQQANKTDAADNAEEGEQAPELEPADTSDYPTSLLNFLQYAPDLVLQIAGGETGSERFADTTSTKEHNHTLFIPPTYSERNGVAGWLITSDLLSPYSGGGVIGASPVGVMASIVAGPAPLKE